MKDKGVVFTQVKEAVLVLTGEGSLYAVQDDALIAKAKRQTDKLNAYLIDKSRGSSDISYLASPVTGGGITVNRFQQLFLFAKSQGKKQPGEWAQYVWQVLASQGQKIIKEGKTLETTEENLAELQEQAQSFHDKQMPIMKALGIV